MNFKNILYNYKFNIISSTSLRKSFRTGSYEAAGSVLPVPLLPCDRSLEPAGAAPLHQIKYRRKVMHHA